MSGSFSSPFPRFGLSEARKTEIRRENRLKQELYVRQKTIRFADLIERSGQELDEYVESQENVFLANGDEARLESDDFVSTTDEDGAENSENADFFVSDDGEIGDDVFRPRSRAAFGRRTSGGANDDGAFEFDPAARPRESLGERLLEQLRLDVSFDEPTPERARTLRKFCEEIVFRLDPSGILTLPNENDDAPFFDALFERKLSPTERELAEKALKIVRTLDPPGVGARDRRDALRLRLRPDATYRRELERLLAEDVFDDFCKKRLASLEEKTRISRETLDEIYSAPFPFFPSPETLFDAAPVAPTIRAEVVVERNADGRWIVRLAESRDATTLDPEYRKMLLSKKIDAKTKEYLRRQYVEARALLDALTSRDATMLRVAKAIVDFQNDFLDAFEKSAETTASPRPLTRLQIADKIGLDPSTISRATADKWLETPNGVLPLKTFFPRAVVGTETPGDVAAKIREIIAREDRAAPLNDESISRRLREDFGVKISRKTVQEHRERLKIPNSRERKRRYR